MHTTVLPHAATSGSPCLTSQILSDVGSPPGAWSVGCVCGVHAGCCASLRYPCVSEGQRKGGYWWRRGAGAGAATGSGGGGGGRSYGAMSTCHKVLDPAPHTAMSGFRHCQGVSEGARGRQGAHLCSGAALPALGCRRELRLEARKYCRTDPRHQLRVWREDPYSPGLCWLGGGLSSTEVHAMRVSKQREG